MESESEWRECCTKLVHDAAERSKTTIITKKRYDNILEIFKGNTDGIEKSETKLCRAMIKRWNIQLELRSGSMVTVTVTNKTKSKNAPSDSERIVVHADTIMDRIYEAHVTELGHAGYRRTFDYLEKRYHGIGRALVRSCIEACPICSSRFRPQSQTLERKYYPVPVETSDTGILVTNVSTFSGAPGPNTASASSEEEIPAGETSLNPPNNVAHTCTVNGEPESLLSGRFPSFGESMTHLMKPWDQATAGPSHHGATIGTKPFARQTTSCPDKGNIEVNSRPPLRPPPTIYHQADAENWMKLLKGPKDIKDDTHVEDRSTGGVMTGDLMMEQETGEEKGKRDRGAIRHGQVRFNKGESDFNFKVMTGNHEAVSMHCQAEPVEPVGSKGKGLGKRKAGEVVKQREGIGKVMASTAITKAQSPRKALNGRKLPPASLSQSGSRSVQFGSPMAEALTWDLGQMPDASISFERSWQGDGIMPGGSSLSKRAKLAAAGAMAPSVSQQLPPPCMETRPQLQSGNQSAMSGVAERDFLLDAELMAPDPSLACLSAAVEDSCVSEQSGAQRELTGEQFIAQLTQEQLDGLFAAVDEIKEEQIPPQVVQASPAPSVRAAATSMHGGSPSDAIWLPGCHDSCLERNNVQNQHSKNRIQMSNFAQVCSSQIKHAC